MYKESDDEEESVAVTCAVISAQSEKYKKARFNDKSIQCRYCKMPGHTIAKCYKLKNKWEYEAKLNDPSKSDDESDNPGN